MKLIIIRILGFILLIEFFLFTSSCKKATNENNSITVIIDSTGLQGFANSPWPGRGHDSRHTCQSPYVGAQTDSLKWMIDLASGTGQDYARSLAIGSDGTLYESGWIKLVAINPDSTKKWEYDAEPNLFFSNEPAIDKNGTIYLLCLMQNFSTGSTSGRVVAINLNGTLKWSFNTGDQAKGGFYGSPVIEHDGTIFAAEARTRILYAIDQDGHIIWKYNTNNDINDSPAIGPDGTVYLTDISGVLYSVKTTGKLNWIYSGQGQIATSPAIAADGTIYYGCDNKLIAVTNNGSLKWKFEAGNIVASAPSIANDGTVYFGCNDQNVYAIASNGVMKWSYLAAGPVSGSAAIGKDGTAYFGVYASTFYAIDSNGNLKWQRDIGGVHTTPVINSDGTVYVGTTSGFLYAFGKFIK